MAITVLNVVLGWTGLGWIGALVWACTTDVEPPDNPRSTPARPVQRNDAQNIKDQHPDQANDHHSAAPAPGRLAGLAVIVLAIILILGILMVLGRI